MHRKITLRLDERVLRRAHLVAVRKNQSLSQWVAGMVLGNADKDPEYEVARQEALKLLEKGLHLGGRPLARERLHAR